MKRPDFRRGFTVIEVIVVVLVVGLSIFLSVVLLTPQSHGTSVWMKDAAQARGIQQAMVVWAGINKDNYPLPSLFDTANATVPEEGQAKDTTANIMSILIWNNGISPELLISPAEANTAAIGLHDRYEYDEPKAAVDPLKALWDPSLKAGLTAEEPGHISYAHLLPFGPRLGTGGWSNTFSASQVCASNRGPEITAVTEGKGGAVDATLADLGTFTFLIHGKKGTWEGNVAYNDNHCNFETRYDPEGMTYQDAAAKKHRDVLFFDEADDAAGTNAFLGIFTRAGAERNDWKAVWD